jgi:hypothetical protein
MSTPQPLRDDVVSGPGAAAWGPGTGWDYAKVAEQYREELAANGGRRYRLAPRLAARWGVTPRHATWLVYRAREAGHLPPLGGV